ncbi:MAG: hypothetical protein QNJ94_07140 [Alphaproteobacteria bacterium]|nr:hypothetical protein [Alphaproteobacteria bacterium]
MTEVEPTDGAGPGQLDVFAGIVPPIELKSIRVMADGRIRLDAPESLSFSFEHMGILFQATVDRAATPAQLVVSCDLGPLPFTSEGPARRLNVATVLRAANLLGAAQYYLSDDQHIRLMGSVEVDKPVTAAAVLLAATELLLAVKPTLELLAHLLADGAAAAEPHGPAEDQAPTDPGGRRFQ